MTTQAADFDPIKFKKSTRQQWENVAEAWNRWGPTLQVWLDVATEAMLQHFFVPSDGIAPVAAEGFLLVFTGEVLTFGTPEGRRGFAGGTLAEVRIGPAGLRLHAGLYRAVAALATAGNNVIVDTAIHFANRPHTRCRIAAHGSCQRVAR